MLKLGTLVKYKGKKFKIIKHRTRDKWIGEYYDIRATEPLIKNYFEHYYLVERSEIEVFK